MVSTRQLGMAKGRDSREGIGFSQRIMARYLLDKRRCHLSPGLKNQSAMGFMNRWKWWTYSTLSYTPHTSGMNENACVMFVASVISATMALVMPILPLNTPCRLLQIITIENWVDKPKHNTAAAHPRVPKTSRGFLPMWSESLPHPSTVTASETKKSDS